MSDVVCVLGMMRTGTSLVAGILDRLGVRFGPEDQLLKANRANPTGFWEHRGIIALNDEILARLGGSWHSPPKRAKGWEGSAELADLRERAESLVRSDFPAGRWGWKDPRTCLTLPFWQLLVPGLRHVICVRRPIDTARSLERMPWAGRELSAPLEQALELWSRYTRDAIAATEGHPRLVVWYEDVLAGPRTEVARLAGFVHRAGALESSEVEGGIREFVQLRDQPPADLARVVLALG